MRGVLPTCSDVPDITHPIPLACQVAQVDENHRARQKPLRIAKPHSLRKRKEMHSSSAATCFAALLAMLLGPANPVGDLRSP